MAQNYTVDFNDKRLTDVNDSRDKELNEIDAMQGEMLGGVEEKYEELGNAAQEYGDKQTEIAKEQGELAVKKLETQQENAKKDYIKEQSGAYADWQKESNKYGVNAEQQAAAGLAGSGFSESSEVKMYTAYQNRVAVARESFVRASTEYDIAIKEAQLQNNSLLAEIAYNTLKTKLELSLEGLQYKNQLLLELSNRKHQVKMDYYTQWKGVLDQINTENALKEQARQADMDNEYKNAALALQREQFEYQKDQDAAKAAITANTGKTITKAKASSNTKTAFEKNSSGVNKNTSGFTGKTYDEAVEYMEKNGIASSYASNIMTRGEFTRAKASGGGRGDAGNYDTYADYLNAYVNHAVGSGKKTVTFPSGFSFDVP